MKRRGLSVCPVLSVWFMWVIASDAQAQDDDMKAEVPEVPKRPNVSAPAPGAGNFNVHVALTQWDHDHDIDMVAV